MAKTKTKAIGDYKIGDELFRHVECGGTFRYIVQGIRTFADGAQLEVEFQPVQVTCCACGQRSAVELGRLLCPVCDSLSVTLSAGEGVFLTGLRLSDEADELGA